MNNLNELEKTVSVKHPGFSSYLECMSRALVTGMASFGLAVSSSYFIQVMLTTRMPYGKKYFMPLSLGFGAIISWKITSIKTKNCQSGWMATEDKHTYFTIEK